MSAPIIPQSILQEFIMPIALIVHGGAGTWRPAPTTTRYRAYAGRWQPAAQFWSVTATRLMPRALRIYGTEDDPVFNAGTGVRC